MLNVIYTDDRFLAKQAIDKHLTVFKKTNPSVTVHDFDSSVKEFRFDAILEEVMTVSLFNDAKFVIIHSNDKDKQKLNDDEIIALASKHSLDVAIVFHFDKKLLAKSRARKYLDKQAQVETIKALDAQAAREAVYQNIKARGIRMKAGEAKVFADAIGLDIDRMNQELTKLAVLDRDITKEDIKIHIRQSQDDSILDLSSALMDRNLDQSLRIYHELLDQKMDPLAIVGMIASQLRTSYQYQLLKEQGMPDTMIAKTMAISSGQLYYVTKRRMGDSKAIGRLLNQLATLEQEAKLGLNDRFIAFELFILNLTR